MTVPGVVRSGWSPRILLVIFLAMSLPVSIRGVPDGKSLNALHGSWFQDEKIAYQLWPFIFPPEKEEFAVILVTLDSIHFNRVDMMSLASRLKKEYPQVPRLKAVLLDNENVARQFLFGDLESPDFVKEERGVYYRDQTRCKEYIQFSTKKARPGNKVRISLKC